MLWSEPVGDRAANDAEEDEDEGEEDESTVLCSVGNLGREWSLAEGASGS